MAPRPAPPHYRSPSRASPEDSGTATYCSHAHLMTDHKVQLQQCTAGKQGTDYRPDLWPNHGKQQGLQVAGCTVNPGDPPARVICQGCIAAMQARVCYQRVKHAQHVDPTPAGRPVAWCMQPQHFNAHAHAYGSPTSEAATWSGDDTEAESAYHPDFTETTSATTIAMSTSPFHSQACNRLPSHMDGQQTRTLWAYITSTAAAAATPLHSVKSLGHANSTCSSWAQAGVEVAMDLFPGSTSMQITPETTGNCQMPHRVLGRQATVRYHPWHSQQVGLIRSAAYEARGAWLQCNAPAPYAPGMNMPMHVFVRGREQV